MWPPDEGFSGVEADFWNALRSQAAARLRRNESFVVPCRNVFSYFAAASSPDLPGSWPFQKAASGFIQTWFPRLMSSTLPYSPLLMAPVQLPARSRVRSSLVGSALVWVRNRRDCAPTSC